VYFGFGNLVFESNEQEFSLDEMVVNAQLSQFYFTKYSEISVVFKYSSIPLPTTVALIISQ